MWRVTFCVLVAFIIWPLSAHAETPSFSNGALVARKMEAHYNAADYKRRLVPVKLLSRVLCAYENALRQVTCSAEMRAQRETDSQWVRVQTTWELTKLSPTRGKLRWQVTGPRVFQSQSQIVAPRYFALARF